MKTRVYLGENSYDILIENNSLSDCSDLFTKYGRVLVVTDSGVPEEYSKKIMSCAKDKSVFFVMPEGEENKNIETIMSICKFMLEHNFSRKDCVCAVGGGVVGDVAAFASSIYMRGVDFYNFPTTLLSMVDSSSGGKTGVDFENVKNILGTFYQPKRVTIDPTVLKTLDKRQIRCGLAEALKMAATFDEALFDFMAKSDYDDNDIGIIIERSVELKKTIVEQDEKEQNIRKSLNFGHTIGHGIEESGKEGLYHGECVAVGMVAMSSGDAKEKITKALKRIGLPTDASFDQRKVLKTIAHDKKATANGKISAVTVETIGKYNLTEMSIEELSERLSSVKGSR